MKNKNVVVFLSVLLAVSLIINSCTKDSPQTAIRSLFTSGTWQLASVMRYNYLGNSEASRDTLNTSCDTTQIFTFTNNSCSYTNYHCIDQPTATGTWSLSKESVNLYVNMTCKDTLPGDSCCTTTHPFANAQIVSIGQYSMKLQTGDIGAYVIQNQKRTLYQYAFVKKSSSN